MDRCLVLDAMPRTHFNSVRQADDITLLVVERVREPEGR